jgi:hypothetical protein
LKIREGMTIIKKSISDVFVLKPEQSELSLISLVLPDENAVWSIVVFCDYDTRPILIDENGEKQSFDQYQINIRHNASAIMCKKHILSGMSEDEYIQSDGSFNTAKLAKYIEAEDFKKDPHMYEDFGGNEVQRYYDGIHIELEKEYNSYASRCYETVRTLQSNISKYPWCKPRSSPYENFSIENFHPTAYTITKSQPEESRTLNIKISAVQGFKMVNMLGKVSMSKIPENRNPSEQILGVEFCVHNLTIVAHRVD